MCCATSANREIYMQAYLLFMPTNCNNAKIEYDFGRNHCN